MARSSSDNCGNCVFYRLAVGNDGKLDFNQPRQCKVAPPSIFPMPTPKGVGFAAVRPSVAAIDWCGKHERSENAIP